MPQRRYYLCPHCSHVFVRTHSRITGNVRCPGCAGKFNRSQITTDQSLIDGCIETRRAAKRSKIAAMVHDRMTVKAIRGKQLPHSRTEAMFKARSVELGWIPHRPSWPDFFVESDGGAFCVEVKAKTDSVSENQRLTFDLLEKHGIKVYIWHCRGDLKTKLAS